MTDAERVLTPEGFAEIQTAVLQQDISVFPARAFYPSSLGHPCDRFTVFRFTRWQEQARHDSVLQSIFELGRDYQPLIYRRLEKMGFEVIRESDRPVQYRVGSAVISGRPDGKLRGFRGTRYQPPRILEAKSMSAWQWDRTATVEDLRGAASVWTRSYYAQGQLYAFLEDTPAGVFVLDNKLTGMLKLIPFELDYGYAEALLQRIERLQPMVQQGVDPEPIPYDWRVCGDCGFRKVCYPPRDFGEGAVVLDDPALVEQLEQREALRQGKAGYDELDREIKTRLKREGVKFAIAGPFVIEGRVVSKKEYAVAAHDEIHYEIRRG